MINASIMHTHRGSFNMASTPEVEAFVKAHGSQFPPEWVTDVLLVNAALNGPDGGDAAIVAYYKKWGAKKIMAVRDYEKPPPGVIINTKYGRFNVANRQETQLFLMMYGNRFIQKWQSDICALSDALNGDLVEAADVLARFNKRWADILIKEETAA